MLKFGEGVAGWIGSYIKTGIEKLDDKSFIKRFIVNIKNRFKVVNEYSDGYLGLGVFYIVAGAIGGFFVKMVESNVVTYLNGKGYDVLQVEELFTMDLNLIGESKDEEKENGNFLDYFFKTKEEKRTEDINKKN